MSISPLVLSTTDSLQRKEAKTNKRWIGGRGWNPEDYPGEHPSALRQPADVCQQAREAGKKPDGGGGLKENGGKELLNG